MHSCDHPASAAWNWADVRAVCLRETRRLLGAGPDAEDAAQEALLRAWRRQATCRSAEEPLAWVRCIARREALRVCGAPRPAIVGVEELPGPLAAEEARWAGTDLPDGLRDLKERERMVVFLRYWADMTQREIALATDLPEGTVKVTLHRARAALRMSLLAASPATR